MQAALEGILVVSIDQAVAAPYAASRLADAGARVIKIERADGDFARGYDRAVAGESAYFVWLNRGKESVVLDLKDPADLALLRRMIGRADVFIQNLAPGAAARAGLDAATLRRQQPRLITCDITGYGDTGPYAQMKAYDLLVQAESGLVAVTGDRDHMGRVGVSVCDIAAGMYAYAAILEALLRRAATGEGAALQVSLFDAMADWMTVPLLQYDYGGGAPPRLGLHHPTIAPYGAYAAGDGGQVVIAIQNEREWRRFCADVLDRPDLADDPRFADNPARVANRGALDGEIAAAFGRWSRAELVARLTAAGTAYGAVNGLPEFSAHPQLRRAVVATAAGPVAMPAPPARVAGSTAALRPVPALGQHTVAVRQEFAA